MKRVFLFSITLLLHIIVFAQNDKRIALVIGNSAYPNSFLKNPVNDATLMVKTLEGLGFTVIKRLNATKAQMEQAVQEFSEDIPTHNVALCYFAGHGIQSNGINYLIPIDAKLDKESDLKFQSISINFIVEEFQQYPKNVNIVILDACRDNPLTNWARGGSRGFKPIEAGSGTIISFATVAGSTASDGEGENGLYTSKLVEQMKISQNIESVFKNTRIEVLKASNNKQMPQEWSMLIGKFRFIEKPQNQINTVGGSDVNNVIPEQSNLKSANSSNSNNSFSISEEILTGGIHVTSQVDGVFYLDGVIKGKFSKGRVYNLKIEIGKHELKVGDWIETVMVEKDKSVEVTALALNFDLAQIQDVSFQMGSEESEDEKPIHIASIDKISIMKHEVTVEQFQQFIDATGYLTDADKKTNGYSSLCWDGTKWEKKDGVNWKCGTNGIIRPTNELNHPVIHVSWNDAVAYSKWLSQKTGKIWRLPTEAEWECAARGGNASNLIFSGGDIIENLAWFNENSIGTTHPVGKKQPNEYGIYDMTGNVWEWCSDWYNEKYYKNSRSKNPIGPSTGEKRVFRGGAWNHSAANCHITYRRSDTPDCRKNNIGFRLVQVP
jgi:formylglycine-generating enzyme required for sulfatase activity